MSEMNWLPIEMGPTDGQRVLLYIPGLDDPVQMGHFEDLENRRHGKVISSLRKWSWGQALFGSSMRPGATEAEPTHWMPLPEPPNQ
jgi:hypothetical protein